MNEESGYIGERARDNSPLVYAQILRRFDLQPQLFKLGLWEDKNVLPVYKDVFEWGYTGTGPAKLAQAILWDYKLMHAGKPLDPLLRFGSGTEILAYEKKTGLIVERFADIEMQPNSLFLVNNNIIEQFMDDILASADKKGFFISAILIHEWLKHV